MLSIGPRVSVLDRIEQATETVAKVVPAPVRKVAYAVTAPLYMGAAFGAVGATVGGTVGALGGPLGLLSVGLSGLVLGASVGTTLGAQIGLSALMGKD